MPLLSVEQIEVHFGGVTALSEVSFDLGDREILGLIGPNGAGKTTLFNVITGFVRPRSGTVSFAGEPITRRSSHQISARGLVRTFQGAAVVPEMSVEGRW
jgi:branched-chain amino acid transport system ATP-binding protein